MKKIVVAAALTATILGTNNSANAMSSSVRIINNTGFDLKISAHADLSPTPIVSSSSVTATDAQIKAAAGSTLVNGAECYAVVGKSIAFSATNTENVLRGKPIENASGWIITIVQGSLDSSKRYLQIAPDSGLK